MADFFSDIKQNFSDILKNMDTENLASLISQIDTLIEKSNELSSAYAKIWKHDVAPSQDVINSIAKVKDSLSEVYHAQEQLSNVMHSAWGANGDAEIKAKIDLYEQLRLKMRELYSATQTAEEQGDKILGNGQKNTKGFFGGEENVGKEVMARVQSLCKTAQDAGDMIIRAFNQQTSSWQETTVSKLGEQLDGIKDKTEKTFSSGNGIQVQVHSLDELLQKYKEVKEQMDANDKTLATLDSKRDINGQLSNPQDIMAFNEGIEKAKELRAIFSEIYDNLKEAGKLPSVPQTDSTLHDGQTPIVESKRTKDATEGNWQAFDGEIDVSWIKEADTSVEELDAHYKALLEDLNQLKSETGGGNLEMMSADQAKEFATISAEMQEIIRLKKEMQGASSQQEQPLGDATALKDVEDRINAIKQQLQETRQGIKESGLFDNEDIENIKNLEAELKRLEGIRKVLDGNQKPAKPVKTEDTKGVEQEKNSINGLLGLLKETISVKSQLASAKSSLPFSSDMQASQAHIKELEKSMKGLSAIWGSLKSSPLVSAFGAIASGAKNVVSLVGHGMVQGFQAVASGAKQLVSTLTNLVSAGFNALKNAVSTTLGNMRSLVTNGFHAVARGVSVVKSAFDSVKKQMHSLTKKATPNLLKSFSSLKSMLMRRVKRTFISAIFNQAKEGIQSLAKYSSSFNQAMSSIKNSAKESAGNLAITLGSLVELIAPALQTLLGWFNQLLIAINTLFALLQGKKSVAVAQKGTDDYAKSLKKAGGAAKDLNHQLYGFDEITRQEDNNGGGGGSGIKYGDQLVEGEFANFFQKIIDAFKAGKFEEVGKLIANALNGIIVKVNDFIVKLRKKATKWASNITRIFNGMLSKKLFQNLGKLIGNGVNLLFDVVNTIFKTLDFKQLGTVVAEAINSIFDTIEWDLVGETFANYFNSIWDYLGTLFGTIDWQKIGYKLSIGLGTFFETLDWDKYTTMLANGINGVFTMFYTLFDGIDWGGIATDFVTSMTDLIENKIQWQTIRGAISEGINGLIDAFDALVNSDFFTSLATELGKTVGGILDDIDWEQLVTDIGTGLGKLREAFWNLITELDIPNLALKLAGAINSLLTDPNVQTAWDESDKKVGEGIKQITTAFSNLLADPPTGIDFAGLASKIGLKIRTLIKMVDFSTVASIIKLGILRVAEAFDAFTESIDFEGIAKQLADGINTFFDPNAKINFSTVTSRVAGGVNRIIRGFSRLLSEIKWEDIRKSLADGITTLVSETDFDGLVTAIGNGVVKASTEFFKLVSSVFDPEEVDGVKPQTLADKLANGINGIFHDANGEVDTTQFQELGKSLGDAIKSIFSNINNFITKTDWGAIGQSIGEALGNIDWLGIASSLITLLWNALIGAVNLAGGLIGGFIRKLFGITDVTVFDATGNEWATQLNESVRESLTSGTTQQQVATAAALYATGLSDAIIGEMNANQQNINVEAQSVASKIAYAIAEYVENPEELDDVAWKLCEALGIKIEDAYALLQADGSLEKFGGLTYDKILEGLANAENGDDVVKFFEQYGITINQSVANGMSQYMPLVAEKGKELMANLQNAQSLEEAKAYFAQAGISVGEEFASKIAGEATENIAAALMLLGQGVSEETINAMDTSNLSQNLSNYMKESGKTLEQIAEELGVDVGNGIGNTIPEAIRKALKIGETQVKQTASEVSASADTSSNRKEAGENATETGETVVENVAEGEKDNVGEVETATESVTSVVQEKYEALPDEVKPYAEKLMEYIVTALQDKDGTVKSAIEAVAQSAVDRAREILAGDVGIKIGEAFIDGINQGMINTYSSVVTNISEECGMMLDSATGKLNYSNGLTIGENMIIGIYNGFYSYSQRLVDFIAHVCNVCAETARQILGIHSPSKVFAEIGAYTMEGMQIGLAETGADAVATVSDVTNAIIEEAENGENVSMQVNAMTDGLDVVESKMSRIAEIFSGIADTITSMGGLQIPTVASGQVIPYRTKVDTNDVYSTGNTLNTNGIEDAIYSAFTRAMSNENNQQPIEVKLVVDGRTLADIVTKKQREQQRAWGV